MAAASELVVLNRKRGSIKGQITRLDAFISDSGDVQGEAILGARLESLERLQVKFEDLKLEYYQLVLDDQFDETEQVLAEMEDDFQRLEVSLKALLFKFKTNSDSSSCNFKVNETSSKVSVKLPEIPLPIFSGGVERWSCFQSEFRNLIEDNPKLTDIQKLFYLRACLKGDAKQIENSDDTYSSLFKALEDRYENSRVLVDTHIKSIINYDKLTLESAKELRKFLDCIIKNLRSLKNLKFDRDNFSNILLVNIVQQKLDRETRKQWELNLKGNQVPNFDELLEFLERRCQVLDSINRNVSIKPKYAFQTEQNSKSRSLFASSTDSKFACCNLCKKSSHSLLQKCEVFLNSSPQERYEIVRENKLCLNCFGRHKVASCFSKQLCSICHFKHHVLIHKEKTKLAPSSPSEAPNVVQISSADLSANSNSHTLSTYFISQKRRVILATAIVYIKDRSGYFRKGRACLDSGSMCHCMTADFANSLGLRKDRINIPVAGLTGYPITMKKQISTVISNENESFSTAIDFLIIPKITDLMPTRYFDLTELKIPSNVSLADPQFFEPGRVDLLVGAEIFFDLLKSDKIRTGQSLIFQETVFGYVVSGAVEGAPETQHCGFLSSTDRLEDTVKKFWELEDVIDPPSLKDKQELECEEQFLKTYRRDKKGKYTVNLPMKEQGLEPGDSMQLARKRLNSLWNRLDKNPEIANLYTNFMKEYEDLGHMQEIKNASTKDSIYVMPHHGVYKAQSSSTKLRVVFDASAPSVTGLSLNNCLLKGGVVQEDLFSILLRFRKHKFVLTADVKKMYRQIWVNPEQCYMQCILWKKGSKEETKLFKLLTVTYGTTCAPFLATRVLKQLAIDEQNIHPLAAAAALTDFYVDDILTGAEDISTALELQRQLVEMLKSGGMDLHKWCSNDKQLLEQVPFSEQEYSFEDSDQDTVKTLGLRWNPKEDNFSFTVSSCSNTPTKRSVLADIARLFDPLGLLGPVITQAKIFLQRLWLLNIEWDQELPFKEKRKWERFQKALPILKEVKISRYVLAGAVKEIEIHGFSDASKDAYGAAVYIRCVTTSNEVTVNLLCSKSRVAPIKVATIPRLELCAAELLSKLVSKLLTSLRLDIGRVHLYTDSTIVLAWIDSSPHLLKVFVSNRISRIQEITKNFYWHHVKTSDNAADLVSRGLSPDQIVGHTLWWYGPDFLHKQTILHSDEQYSTADETYVQEFKKVADVTLNLNIEQSFFDSIINSTNSYSKLIRITGFVFRFSHNLKSPLNRISGPLSYQELQSVTTYLVRYVQKGEFVEDINNLRKGNFPTARVRNLNPYLDKNNILRVGGRLQNCNLGDAQLHPIILPAKHKFTDIIIEYFHKKYFHLGPQNLLYCIRREFWPLNGRSNCRKIVYNCVTCFRAKPVFAQQMMGDLPKERVNVNFPFNCTGVDFCGPFLIMYKGQRKGIYRNIYVCIFICMVTKAVHLDIVCDLSADAFIATLKRFFARRGKSHTVFSDNAKNFVGTNSELKRLHNLVNEPDNTLANYLSSEGIQWKFIPPRAPNFGGLWEAGVKSFKYHLKRVVGNSKLTYEEFLTITTQIEGILNSRPLTPLSSDMDDLEVLTPGHFLIGRPINALSEPNLIDVDNNRLKLWQRATKMVQIIWKKWQNNYLNNLQQRNKWRIVKNNIKVGDMVILKEDNLPACKWHLGRIVEIFPGDDGLIRVVKVKTKNTVLKRPISKICVLPSET